MQLTGTQCEQLVNALMDAYPTPDDLRLLVSYKLSENLYAIAKENNLEAMTHDVVMWARSCGRMKELIVGAVERNAGNVKLCTFAAENGVSVKASPFIPSSPQPDPKEKPPKDALFSSKQFKICSRSALYYREELFISQVDAQQRGVDKTNCFAILSILPDHPGPPPEQYAVRLIVDPQLKNGLIHVNQHFADKAFKWENTRTWTIKLAKNIVHLRKAVLEPATEQDDIERECSALRKQRHDLFTYRCLLVGEKKATLSLYAIGKGYFHLPTIEPELQTLQPDTVLVLDEQTELELFVSHRKKAVDMVILVDISTSMDCEDYVGANNRVGSRLMGVQKALETLFHRRLAGGSRLSRIGIIVFSGGPTSWHPARAMTMMEVKNTTHINDIRSSLQKLNKSYLDTALPRGGTNIVAALQLAADTVNMCSQEGNEKVLLLLSDGADWTRSEDENRYGEIAGTSDDPVVLAENLHHSSDIRIHTVAISNERAFRRFADPRHWHNKSAIPNVPLLRNIASSTRGRFFEGSDAQVLAKLFDEIGQGIRYPLTK